MPNYNLTDTNYLRSDQYKDSTNLDARAYLHDHFSTNKTGLQRWIFDQFIDLEIQRILDLGCGPGYLWVQNSERIPAFWELTLADISLGMLKEGRGQIPSIVNPLDFTVSNAQSLPFPPGSFDLIIANHMLYHVPDLEGALAEIRRVLRLGGQLHCTTNSNHHMKELFALLQSVGIPPSKWQADGSSDLPFSLENGLELLGKCFSTVELRVYEDSLKVTEIDPLLDYICSMSGVRESLIRDPEQLSRLQSSIKNKLDSRGFFHISKSPGLFIAR